MVWKCSFQTSFFIDLCEQSSHSMFHSSPRIVGNSCWVFSRFPLVPMRLRIPSGPKGLGCCHTGFVSPTADAARDRFSKPGWKQPEGKRQESSHVELLALFSAAAEPNSVLTTRQEKAAVLSASTSFKRSAFHNGYFASAHSTANSIPIINLRRQPPDFTLQ
jgi:hypothetical protein